MIQLLVEVESWMILFIIAFCYIDTSRVANGRSKSRHPVRNPAARLSR